jgi:hypothetical protein
MKIKLKHIYSPTNAANTRVGNEKVRERARVTTERERERALHWDD